MDADYEPVYPSGAVDADIQAFLARFYAVSDRPDRDDEWLGFFDEGATLVMGPQAPGHGKDGSSVSSFTHPPC